MLNAIYLLFCSTQAFRFLMWIPNGDVSTDTIAVGNSLRNADSKIVISITIKLTNYVVFWLIEETVNALQTFLINELVSFRKVEVKL